MLALILLAMPVIEAARCGNQNCDGNENCGSCPQDCLKQEQICCNGRVYSGECCTNDDCEGNAVCSSLHKCISKALTTAPVAAPASNENTTGAAASEAGGGINWEMIGVILVIIFGIGGWILTKKRRSLISKYIKNINNVYNSCKNNSAKCEAELNNLKEQIEKDFAAGKITEQSYDILNKKIEDYVKNLRKGIIKAGFELTPDIKKELHNMLEDGIVTEKEYAKFIKVDIKGMSEADRAKLNYLVKKWKEKDRIKKIIDDNSSAKKLKN